MLNYPMNHPFYRPSRIEACYEAKEELCKALIEKGIDYFAEPFSGGWKLSFGSGCDVVCHSGSYGGELGLWESYGFPSDNDDVTGWLSTEEVLEKLSELV